MPLEYPRNLAMRGSSKMRGSQHSERDVSPSVQMRRQQQIPLPGSMAILWDMENCPVPSDVKADDVAGNVRMALRQHPAIQGAVTFFSAYGDFNHFQRKVREGCQRTGVNLIDVPNGKKDASDKAILVDLFLFALDNRPPCTIFLISGDVDFAPALHKLGQRGYTVVLAIPSGVGVSSALFSAGRYVWDWPSVARGGGLVLARNFPCKAVQEDRMAEMLAAARANGEDRTADVMPMPSRDRMTDVMPSRAERLAERMAASRPVVENRTHEIIELNGGYSSQAGPAWGPSDDSDLAGDDPVPDEEEKIVWKTSDRPHRGTGTDSAVKSGLPKMDSLQKGGSSSSAQHLSSAGKPPQGVNILGTRGLGGGQVTGGAREASFSGKGPTDAQGGSVAAAKGGLQTLPAGNLQLVKDQLVKLLQSHGSKLELNRVPAEYEKQFGKPLNSAEYGQTGTKLVERLPETVSLKGEEPNKVLHLTKAAKAKLKRDAKNARALRREEIEASEASAPNAASVPAPAPVAKIQADEPQTEDEMAGEQVVASFATQTLKAPTDEASSPRGSDKGPQMPELAENLEELRSPVYDSGSNSAGSGGSGDEKDGDPQDEKDVEVKKSILEQVRKREWARENAKLDILDVFRVELEELLVSHACKIPRNEFEKLYEQRYSKTLDYAEYGASDLEALIGKVSDVAVMLEESGSKDKYLVAS